MYRYDLSYSAHTDPFGEVEELLARWDPALAAVGLRRQSGPDLVECVPDSRSIRIAAANLPALEILIGKSHFVVAHTVPDVVDAYGAPIIANVLDALSEAADVRLGRTYAPEGFAVAN